jgi:Zn-dependent protease with chaperone function
MQPHSVSNDSLKTIRFALAGGVFALGAVAFFMTWRQPANPDTAEIVGILVRVFVIVSGGSLASLVAFRALQSRERDAERRGRLSVAAWAMAEVPALIGGVIYMMSGTALYYAVGFAILFAAFATVPIPEDR